MVAPPPANGSRTMSNDLALLVDSARLPKITKTIQRATNFIAFAANRRRDLFLRVAGQPQIENAPVERFFGTLVDPGEPVSDGSLADRENSGEPLAW